MSRVRVMRREACRLREQDELCSERTGPELGGGPTGRAAIGKAGSSGVEVGDGARYSARLIRLPGLRSSLKLVASGMLGAAGAGAAGAVASIGAGAPASIHAQRRPGAISRGMSPHYCVLGLGCGYGQPWPGDTSSEYVTVFTQDGEMTVTVGVTSYTLTGFEVLGCRDAQGAQSAIRVIGSSEPMYEILDFGMQYAIDGTRGAVMPGDSPSTPGAFLSDQQIVGDAEEYLYGWSICGGVPTNPVVFAIGTSNYGTFVNSSSSASAWAGADWATHVIVPLNLYADDNFYVTFGAPILGANDIESWSSSTDSYANAGAWAGGYHLFATDPSLGLTPQQQPYIDYGAADCSPNAMASLSTLCGLGWTVGDYYNIAWGNGWARAIPEMYDNTWAAQWKGISWAGRLAPAGPIDFSGVLWSPGAGNGTVPSTQSAWNDLENQYMGVFWTSDYQIGLTAPSWLAASCIPADGAASDVVTSTNPYPGQPVCF